MSEDASKESYYENILCSIIELGEGDNFVVALCQVIQRLAIDHLHIVGDIFDRGKGPDIIMDRLMNYHDRIMLPLLTVSAIMKEQNMYFSQYQMHHLLHQ